MVQTPTAGKREPAWKRLGLKIKRSLADDPLAIAPVHLAGISTEDDSSSAIESEATKTETESKKRKLEKLDEDQTIEAKSVKKSKKAPKRKKLPKNKRPAPPEKDQLAYLRTFYKDKEHWKFSKQKQNWLLRNIRQIPEKYDDYLKAYLSTMKGGSRDRLIQEMKEVVEKWNLQIEIAAKELEEKKNENVKEEGENKEEKSEEEKEENEDQENKDKEDEDKKDEKKEADEKKDEDNSVDMKYAMRAAALYNLMAGEEIEINGIEENDEKDEKEEKDEEIEKPSELVVEDIDVKDYISKDDYRIDLDDVEDDKEEEKDDDDDDDDDNDNDDTEDDEKKVKASSKDKDHHKHHKHHKHHHKHSTDQTDGGKRKHHKHKHAHKKHGTENGKK